MYSKLKKIINLSGNTALITGACGNLGTSISQILADVNCNLVLTDVDKIKLKNAAQSLSKNFKIKVMFFDCDLEKEIERENLLKQVLEYNSLDILINNAAFVGTTKLKGWAEKLESQSLETWRRAIEVNLTSSFHLCQKLSPLLKKTKNGSIINIGSIYGMYGPDWRIYENTKMANPAAYSVSKAGLIQLTKWLSTTLSPEIRVNCISPGGIERGQPNSFISAYKNKTPLGRMACEEDIQGAILFLATSMSKYVTGQNISVDGGWGAW